MMLFKILFRNAFHNKLRSSLTILGIAVAILAFGLLRTVVSSFYAGVEAASTSRLVTRNAISIIFSLPISYTEKIRQVEGAGKGETVNLLNEWMDPRHIHAHAFSQPSDEERERPAHWRFWRALPPKGEIGIFFGAWHTMPIVQRVMGEIGKGEFSAVLSMYHDQGHIASKTLDFARTVSVTLGMPLLRTSVDHGTAFDIAGTGVVKTESMVEAMRQAVSLAATR